MFIYQTRIKLHETDAAGLLFFSNQFKMIHDAYEALLETVGFGFAGLIREKDFFLPIVHAQCDYKMPLFVGDLIEIRITPVNIGKTSITFGYHLLNARQEAVGSGQTVHVAVDKETRKKIPLPADLRTKIENLYSKDSGGN